MWFFNVIDITSNNMFILIIEIYNILKNYMLSLNLWLLFTFFLARIIKCIFYFLFSPQNLLSLFNNSSSVTIFCHLGVDFFHHVVLWQPWINILDGSFKSKDFSMCPILMKLYWTILTRCAYVMETCGIIEIVLLNDLNEKD
jgi:hypothetical protein